MSVIVSPVPVQPDMDSKKAERKSMVTAGFVLSNPIKINGIQPISEINSHPKAAVTIALLKLEGSAFLNIQYRGVPTPKNTAAVMSMGPIPYPSLKYRGTINANRVITPIIINMPPTLYFYLFLISFNLLSRPSIRSFEMSLFVNTSAFTAIAVFVASKRAIFPLSAFGDLFNSGC